MKVKHFTAVLLLGLAAAASGAEVNRGRERFERAIRHELVMLPYYGVFDRLAYRVEGSKITLLGEVTRPTLKRNAEQVVKQVEGVESVDNQIEVLPLSNHDDRVRLAAFRKIYGDSVLSRYGLMAVPSIHIIVKNGHITLDGVVDSEADRNIAGIRAREVSGAFSITNNLRVAGKS